MKLFADGVAELCFERADSPINKFDALTMTELREALQVIASEPRVLGLLATSAKDVFVVGADITEFVAMFDQPVAELASGVRRSSEVFVTLEDLQIPTVAAINGYALGGGFEFALACCIRVMSDVAHVGLPEVSLGVIPGFGGTVRMCRTAGIARAIDWVTSGKPADAQAALAARAVDSVVAAPRLREHALEQLRLCMGGRIDWRSLREGKLGPVKAHLAERAAVFAESRSRILPHCPPHQPAAAIALDAMEQGAALERGAALDIESMAFAQVAKTQAAAALVQKFLNGQQVKRLANRAAKGGTEVASVGILGDRDFDNWLAVMVAQAGLCVQVPTASIALIDDLIDGVSHAGADQRQTLRDRIQAPVSAAGQWTLDTVIAPTELQLEPASSWQVSAKTVPTPRTVLIAGCSGDLRLKACAANLHEPGALAGLHFPQPVEDTQIVEVVRGVQTSDAAVAAATGFALRLGKTPIVVQDHQGYVVNRMRAAYVRAALCVMEQGVLPARVDRILADFGWRFGPVRLMDIMGMDQVNKQACALSESLVQEGTQNLSDDEVVERVMLAFLVEAVRLLEEAVVSTAAEVDIAALQGVGCPAWIGGPLTYADWLGLAAVVKKCDALKEHHPACAPTARMRAMEVAGDRFYPAMATSP
ncbi:MAG: enoyl-CoA hydratase/isomerase family protein [Hydrogenophaga sp.]|uniref:enoyl-CoA hydratase-related protein n=1 Tax=Hydrogenophaga sp. TaxID=1904254 RepID=UPI00260B4D38|nr:enoyl-CoA hydratase-related protein [Hydrogenophaga sp.]MCV0437470.1 enoyl-CoA hydratase/isomerase family protein [Hydrogenophaga sp.]